MGSAYDFDETTDDDYGTFTSVIKSAPLKQTHAILFKKTAIAGLIPYFEAILARKFGDPDGGPMHVDGAYAWFRNAHPSMTTMAAKEQSAVQRSSKTDIHDTGWKEYIPLINLIRKIKNKPERH